MSKGEIVLVPFPFTNLTGQKVRPALVLHASRGEDCILAFISSQRGERKNPFDVPIAASRANGLKADSIIKVDKIATLQKKIVIGELGIAEKGIHVAIDVSLKKLFKL